ERVGLATRERVGRGLVGGRRAARGRRDVGVAELQPVVAILGGGLGGEACLPQRAEEPVAALVAREHAARAIAAVGGRRQPHQQQARARIAEARERPGPVLLASIPAGGGAAARPPAG